MPQLYEAPAEKKQYQAPKSWRDVLPIHPAADLFPLMGEAELRALAEDIKNNGLKTCIVLWTDGDWRDTNADTYLLDGRNRLDAMEMVGIRPIAQGKLDWCALGVTNKSDIVAHLFGLRREDYVGKPPVISPGCDPYAYVLSANIHRRHLTPEQRRDLITKLLKAKPETSNLQIAKQVKADDKTVAKVRTELEATSEIPKLTKTVGKDGKSRPTRKTSSHQAAGKAAGALIDPAPIVDPTTTPSGKKDPGADYLKALAESLDTVAQQIAYGNQVGLKAALTFHLRALKRARAELEVAV